MTKFPVQPSDVVPIPHAEFMVAFAHAEAAYGAETLIATGQRAPHTGEDGTAERAPLLREGPGTRLFVAVCEHFGDDANRAAVWLLRFWAMQVLENDPRMEAWIDSCVEPRGVADVYEGVFEAAASQPLNGCWEFDADAFFAAVEALHNEGKYLS